MLSAVILQYDLQSESEFEIMIASIHLNLLRRRFHDAGVFAGHARVHCAVRGSSSVVSFICSNVLPFVSHTVSHTKGSEIAAAIA